MHFHDDLKTLGLHDSEIKVYLYLLEQGISTPPHIARGTKIARTNCYNILVSLKEKGLIEEHKSGQRKAYLASDPEALLRTLEQRKDAIARILPDLRALHTLQKNKPKITFYDGLEQIKEIYWQSLKSEEIFAFASSLAMQKAASELFDWYGDEVKERGIIFHEIASHASGQTAERQIKEKLKGLYDYKVLDSKHGEFQTDILVWNESVALITYEEPFFGTLLVNQTLAHTYRVLFKALWDKL